MKRKRDEIVVIGAGGHARVVIEAVEKQGRYRIAWLVDDAEALKGKKIAGYPVVGDREDWFRDRKATRIRKAVVALGDNGARVRIAAELETKGVTLVSPVHPSAVIARRVEIGAGTVVLPGVVVNPDAKIGKNVILNSGSVVEHDCVLEDGVHVAPGAALCGGVRVGAGTLLGVGAKVVPGITIGRNAVVGAGATVLRDVPEGAKVGGTPARPLEA